MVCSVGDGADHFRNIGVRSKIDTLGSIQRLQLTISILLTRPHGLHPAVRSSIHADRFRDCPLNSQTEDRTGHTKRSLKDGRSPRSTNALQGYSISGSEQEFDGRPVLWAFRRFYSIFDLCCSRLRGAASSPDPRMAAATSTRLCPIFSE